MKKERGRQVYRAPRAGKARRRGAGRWLWACGVLAVLLAAACGVFAGSYFGWLRLPDALQAQVDILPDVNARTGSLKAGGGEPVEAGFYQAVFNQAPTLAPDGSCSIEFENPETNHYNARLALYDGATGELLGSTHRVDPGRYVETLRLDTAPPPGVRPALAVIELFEGKTPVGSLKFEVTLTVAEKEGG